MSRLFLSENNMENNEEKEVNICERHDCECEPGIDYESEDLQEIAIGRKKILVCPDCYDKLMDENVDSDFSDYHPEDSVEAFNEDWKPDPDD